MPELIDRDALMRKHTTSFAHDNKHNTAEELHFLFECIRTAPIIHIMRRGRWIQSDALDYEDPNGGIHVHGMCSCCLKIYDFGDMISRFKFCPNCGARMDGGADNVSNV